MDSSQNDMPPNNSRARAIPQGIFWICTVKSPHALFPLDSLPSAFKWIKGQQEIGAGGYEHWQFIVATKERSRMRYLVDAFGAGHHYELTKSKAAETYVWKEESRVPGTQFEFGAKPIRVNSSTDWDSVWDSAKAGDIDRIPARIRLLSYRTIR